MRFYQIPNIIVTINLLIKVSFCWWFYRKMRNTKTSRVVLTPQLAREIYLYKAELESLDHSATLLKGRSVSISKKYNVSPKAIRDVWNRRTWVFATETIVRNKEPHARVKLTL